MAQRKLQQEVDRCFKRVAEGIQAFESIFEKIQQTSNASQKDKLEDALKREIKKLQRHRDQIKTWAASNEIKDKKPLLEQRKLIETQMEKFKAVEKEMKTKAYSKEGLSAAAKLDPKEKEKLEVCQFLASMVEELERQIETSEAEAEAMQAGMKKGKKDSSKADRVAEIEHAVERHKWHVGKLEFILRLLENGQLEADQVTPIKEDIKYYVDDNQKSDFMEDEGLYDDLNLEEEEAVFGINNDNDRVSSQDAQSIQDDLPDVDMRPGLPGKSKSSSISEGPAISARRPSTQMKSPLPALATLHPPMPSTNPSSAPNGSMKPAPLPTRAPGETLKYASAAAAAAASDKNGTGIAPLPPPPGMAPPQPAQPPSANVAPLPAARTSATISPSAIHVQPTSATVTPGQKAAVPVSTISTIAASDASPVSQAQDQVPRPPSVTVPTVAPSEKIEGTKELRSSSGEHGNIGSGTATLQDRVPKAVEARANENMDGSVSQTNGDAPHAVKAEPESSESVFHLPPGLQDLIQSFELTKARVSTTPTPQFHRLLSASLQHCPESIDADKPRHYKPQTRYNTPPHYPQEPLPIFDDPRLYSRIDTDTLFYVFYYRQGTYQQYLAAKELKKQSWRFHKQYQTWFQRHEEPKTITEEYEQGTYRFFDYESTWMNRRKADFKFAYKFLEDDL